MRTHLSFSYPAPFVGTDEYGADVLSESSVGWFQELLKRVPGVELDRAPCQEDWGVVIFVKRHGRQFWIGLNFIEEPHTWLAHVHHGSFAWLQRWSRAGTAALDDLVTDLERALREAGADRLSWFDEKA